MGGAVGGLHGPGDLALPEIGLLDGKEGIEGVLNGTFPSARRHAAQNNLRFRSVLCWASHVASRDTSACSTR